MKSLLEDL